VLAQHQVCAVLLGATDGDQQRGGAGGDAVAQLGRGQLLEVHRGVGLRGCAGGNEGHSQEPAPRRFNGMLPEYGAAKTLFRWPNALLARPP